MKSFPSLLLSLCRTSCSSRRSGRPTSAVQCFHNRKEKEEKQQQRSKDVFHSYAFIVYLLRFSIVSMSGYSFLQPDRYEWMNWILDVQQLFYKTIQTQWFIPAYRLRPHWQSVGFCFHSSSHHILIRIYLQLRFNIKPNSQVFLVYVTLWW